MSHKVTVVDYGMGNLFSVMRAFEHCGAEVHFTQNPQDIQDASRLVIPGVGAFRAAMERLHSLGLVEPILKYAEKERPLLGICLGMQMLMDQSLENGLTQGLGLISGGVHRIPSTNAAGKKLKIPHIGWAKLKLRHDWQTSLLKPFNSEKDHVYLVHSWMAMPEDPKAVIAVADYEGVDITACIRSQHIVGCQFHPEKSGPSGLRLIEEFLTS